MKSNIFYPVILSALLTGCSPGGGGTGMENNAGTETGEQVTAANEQVVEILELREQLISRSIEYTATMIPARENHLASSSPGRIEKIFVETGDRVDKDEVLVQMDRTQLHQAMIQLNMIETDFRRLDTLNKVGSISKQQYDQVKSQYDVAKSNLEFLRENTLLRAPFRGVISGRYYEDGEFYSGAPNTAAGKAAIVSLVQLDPLKAEVNVSENYFPMISSGMDAVVTSDIYPGSSFPGSVAKVHPTIDPATRSFILEVRIYNEKEMLRPGMFSRVSIRLGEQMALVVPAVAVLKLQGSNERYLFLEEGGKARRINVEIGKRFDDKIEVVSGELAAGSRLIVSGQARLVNGDRVKVVDR